MRNFTTKKSGTVGGVLLPMGLVCLFAFCSLTLALLGASAYRQIQARVDDSHSSTVVSNYLHTKLITGNTAGAVSIRQQDGYEALVIANKIGDIVYETRIFVIDGAVTEVYTAAGMPLSPMGGTPIASVESCTFSISPDGLFNADIVSTAGVHTRTAVALIGGGL